MMRLLAFFAVGALLTPSLAFASTCVDRNEACSLGELMDISAKAQTLGVSQQEHIAILLEIITNLRRIITNFKASSQVSDCVDLAHDLRPGTNDAKTDGEVSELQYFLTRELVYSDLITGFYGPQTARAVYEWQKEQAIPDVTEATGVGKITRQKIRHTTCASLDA
jgi:hypothetical protein